jgi:hypothetical protein
MNPLDRIGEWDKRISQASLEGPYENWLHQEIPFGLRSLFLAPWRAYMDTWDSRRYLDVLGVNFNVRAEEAEATAQVLGEAGIRSARIEIGWANLKYEDESQIVDYKAAEYRTIFNAFKKYGIRPLILLNANSGLPVPHQYLTLEITRIAAAGAREIYVSDVSQIQPGYTGLHEMSYHTMFPVITAVEPETGRLTLSAPLPRQLPQGKYTFMKLKYRPFAGYEIAGQANPSGPETVNGWMRYVQTVTSFVRDALGTAGQPDAGFDVEVWNEYMFGSEFLDINNYYDPDLTFSKPITYTHNGETVTGVEAILPMTVDFVKNPQNALPGVRVISGFANQRPWESGTEMYPRQDGFSRHYYTSYSLEELMINPVSFPRNDEFTVDAKAERDGIPAPNKVDRIIPGTNVIPVHVKAFPEVVFYAYQTEFVVRDLQPYPGPWYTHHRYSNPGNGHEAEVWMTETNFYRMGMAQELSARAGVDLNDERIARLLHHLAAKTTLRIFVFYGHKGIQTVNLFAAKDPDTNFSLIPLSFYNELAENGYTLTDSVREHIGPQVRAVANLTRFMQAGERIDNPRFLQVKDIVEHMPRVVFQAHATEEHPHRYHRDDLAVMPYQLSANKFAVGYYVVTRNILHSWKDELDVLDPQRYDMPPQVFEITLSNVRGNGAAVLVYDPVTGEESPATIVRSALTEITVRVEAVDYPRFLVITESQAGPLLQEPKLEYQQQGSTLSFVPNVDGRVTISWGPYPIRARGSFTMEEFAGENLENLIATSQVPIIRHYNSLASRKGSWRWTGTIVPKYTEEYHFILDTDNSERPKLWICDQLVIEGNGRLRGSIMLEAGKAYTLTLTYSTPYASPHTATLYWASASQPREVVAPSPADGNRMVRNVSSGQRVTVRLPGLAVKDGVKVELSSSGLSTRYPHWDYDVRGVIW